MGLSTLIFLVLFHQCLGERKLFCPNNGTPKPEIKCLPGQNDNNVCGEGYSCFFSGINYHCCPSGDETANEHERGECPDYTFAVLDSAGKPVQCSTLGKECPGTNTYCNENSPVPICCQNLKASNEPKNPGKQQELQAVEDFFSADEETQKSTTTIDKPEDAECPKNSLTVLTEDGEPTYCTNESDCPQSSMTCYGDQRKICCESVGTIGGAEGEKKHTTNIINIRPNSTQSIQTTTSQSTTKTVNTSTTKKSVEKTDKIGISEAIYKKQPSSDKIPTKEEKPKVFASKTATFDDNAKPVKYRPHNSGGYAVSQNIKNDAGQIDKKEIVQQYLLEQIKQGWPYDEKFYRPENTAVIQTGRRPSTIVHFP